ncbi:MAG: 3-dehydroquinate dehydratase [Ignavibacterium sp.]|nr:3-dehydroquinate dehydratase [Ignavibacterium sp.]MDW8375011.1 type II 3-dehydroquinate dehydratase [Ignavibacteriales bacterium]
MKILIINGPNLNLLHLRDENLYGNFTLDELQNIISNEFPTIDFEFFQSNDEGSIINKIQAADNFDGLIINPGGYAHTSVAIKDALELLKIPKVEVHLSNLSNRDSYRQNLITASSCDGYISGFKHNSYLAAVYLIIKMQNKI